MPVLDTIQVRRGTAAQWAAADPILAAGEPGLDTTNSVLKLGDGATHWSALAAAGAGAFPVLNPTALQTITQPANFAEALKFVGNPGVGWSSEDRLVSWVGSHAAFGTLPAYIRSADLGFCTPAFIVVSSETDGSGHIISVPGVSSMLSLLNDLGGTNPALAIKGSGTQRNIAHYDASNNLVQHVDNAAKHVWAGGSAPTLGLSTQHGDLLVTPRLTIGLDTMTGQSDGLLQAIASGDPRIYIQSSSSATAGVVWRNDANVTDFTMYKAGGAADQMVMYFQSRGSAVQFGGSSKPILTISAKASETQDLERAVDNVSALLWRLNKNGYPGVSKVAAPADAELNTSEMMSWWKNTVGAAGPQFKGRDSATTVVTFDFSYKGAAAAAATDLASVITLANDLRTKLIATGLMS